MFLYRYFSKAQIEFASRWAMILGGSSGCCFFLAINGPFIDRYKKIVHMYKDGEPCPMEPELEELCQQTLSEIKLNKNKKKDISFFKVFGDDVFHAGCLEMNYPTLIGVPHNFTYKKQEDIDQSELSVLNGQAVKWESKSGIKLLDSLLLSEKAKKFAIAREIYQADTYFYVWMSCAICVSMVLARALTMYCTKVKGLASKPFVVRFSLYGLASMIGFWNFIILKDSLNSYHEGLADTRAVLNGDDYYDGGLEYYQKQLQRNKAFRKMLGKDGPKFFTEEGNQRYSLVRTPTLPLTQRLYRINEIRNADTD